MYTETRQYVLRRADSVKQLGTAVLDSRVTAVTATALDRALTTADKYVDKYLPPDNQDASDGKFSSHFQEDYVCFQIVIYPEWQVPGTVPSFGIFSKQRDDSLAMGMLRSFVS